MRLKHTGSGSLAVRSQFSSQFKKPEILQEQIQKIPAILVSRQTGGIGDVLMITPTVRAIKQANPSIPLIFCTTNMYGGGKGTLFDILRYNPYIDKVITNQELINYTFKRIYNFGTGQEIEQELAGNKKNRIDIFADLAGIELTDKSTVYTLHGSEMEWASNWIKKNISASRRFLFGIQVNSTSPKRDWPEEKISLLVFTILNSWLDASVLLFYEGLVSTNRLSYPNIYNIVGMPIRWVAALLNECQAIVVPDSGLLHIAGALRKKMVGLFGSIPPELRISYYPEAISIYQKFPCSPCWYEKCKNGHRCMESITVDMVMDKLSEILDRKIERRFGERVLVVRMGGLGDLIMLTPSLRSLHKIHKSKIVLATSPENIFVMKGLPYIDSVIPIREAESDRNATIIDLRYRVESPEVGGTLNTKLYTSVNRIDMFARLMKVELDDRKVDVALDQHNVSKVKKLIKYSSKFKYIGIQASCTSNLRTIPPQYIPELASKLTKIRNLKVVIFGRSEFWHGRIPAVDLRAIKGRKIINLMDKMENAGDLIALCSIVDYLVAPDSSAIHIAAALYKPCLALFGNIDPYLRTHYYPTVKNLYPSGELECIPCWDFQNPCIYYKSKPTREQPIGGKCMYLLTPDRIFESIKKNLFEKGVLYEK